MSEKAVILRYAACYQYCYFLLVVRDVDFLAIFQINLKNLFEIKVHQLELSYRKIVLKKGGVFMDNTML